MDIKIEASKHPNQEQLKTFYCEKLQKKYGNYDFVKSIDVKIAETQEGKMSVALQIKPEKGSMLYAKQADKNEHTALNSAIRKMNTQIENTRNNITRVIIKGNHKTNKFE